MINSANFWDKRAKKYAILPIKNMQAYTETMDNTKARLSKDDNVLEIGCGTGSSALLLAEEVKQITACDSSGNMIDIGKAKANDQQIKNIKFMVGTVFDDPLEEQSFDVVLAYNILHLLEDLPETLRRVNRLLKPEGLFISKTVCMKGQRSPWRVVVPIMRAVGLAPYVGFLTVLELENHVTREGFEIIDRGDFPASPPSRFIVAKKT